MAFCVEVDVPLETVVVIVEFGLWVVWVGVWVVEIFLWVVELVGVEVWVVELVGVVELVAVGVWVVESLEVDAVTGMVAVEFLGAFIGIFKPVIADGLDVIISEVAIAKY